MKHAARDFTPPPWSWAVRDLLQLACRFHVYIRLYVQRDPHLWKRRLNDKLWSPPRPPCALTPHIQSYARLDDEGTEALAVMNDEEESNDRVIVFLRRLDRAAAADPLADGDWKHRPAWLRHVWDALHAPLPLASDYVAVAEALKALTQLQADCGPGTLGGAWRDFGQELAAPRVPPAVQPVQGPMVDVLNVPYHNQRRHAAERPPADVLGDVFGVGPATVAAAPPPAAAPLGFDATRRLLIAHLQKHVVGGSPEEAVLLHAMSNVKVSFDTMRDVILSHPPATLDADLLSEAQARLEGWRADHESLELRLRHWNPAANPPESLELLDLANDACNAPALNGALALVAAWIERPGEAPSSWGGSPSGAHLAIRSAVLSACLDRLWEGMDDFFNGRSLPSPAAPPPGPAVGPAASHDRSSAPGRGA